MGLPLTNDLFLQVLRAACLPRPELEYPFAAPERRWRFDFAWPGVRLALEKEGGVYGRGKPCPVCKRRPVGAHSSISDMKRDMEKYNEATIRGWRVLRARPEQFDSGEVIPLLERAFRVSHHE
jgi:hypothetical protein